MITTYRKHWGFVFGIVILSLSGLLLARHLLQFVADDEGVQALWLFMSAHLAWQLMLAWTERTYRPTPDARLDLDEKFVTVNVPLYNEDPSIVREVLESLFNQTRKPNRIDVVDDGSSVQYLDTRAWFNQQGEEHDIECHWMDKPNGGKRSAQLMTFANDDRADFFATMDSDTILAPTALEQALLPFACDERIKSVASVVLAKNAKSNIVSRLTDLLFINFQLGIRSALSKLKSVLVNSGSFAVYRAEIIREAIPVYESETFMGRPVQFSDDSLLTLLSYLRGRTVQQPSSICYTYLPTKVSHHLRQQLRWARGSTIRSIWRFNYLPKTRIAYWEHYVAWMSFAIVCVAFSYLVVYRPVVELDTTILPQLLLFTFVIGFLNNMKYLTLRRPDVSFVWQILTFLMTPALMVWTALVLRPLRIYGMLTCRKTGWGTRKNVEVKAVA